MSPSEAQSYGLRSSKSSRLPGPSTTVGAGLTEWTDSQHNRSQSAIPGPATTKGIKREIPQPAPQPEAKRKLLSERAIEYPAKASASTLAQSTRAAVKGQTLASMSQLKQPTKATSNTLKASTSGLTRSVAAARNVAPVERPVSRAQPRSMHTRSKSQAAIVRPRTVHGHREEESFASSISSSNVFDVEGRVGDMESSFKELKDIVNSTLIQKKGHDDALEMAKTRVSELEGDRKSLSTRNETLKQELEDVRDEARELKHQLEDSRRQHQRDVDELSRTHKQAEDDLARQHQSSIDQLSREIDLLKDQEVKEHQEQINMLKRQHQQALDDEKQRGKREAQDIQARMNNEQQEFNISMLRKDRDVQEMRSECDSLRTEVDRQKGLNGTLQASICELSAANTTFEAKVNSLRLQVDFLESDSKAQSDSFADMETKLQEALRMAEEADRRLMKAETERRVLFNKYQELKGNIRVMCRVRPARDEIEGAKAGISFPDDKTSAEILLAGPEEKSSLGAVTRKNYPFEFDRVFTPSTQNEEIFGEISQLVQSALDGYNVCIFCYGQTGSGKTYTMSSPDGMIPRATHMIYDTIEKLKEKSWTYTMEGCFVEVYNEELNDLLTPNDRNGDSKSKKLEIRHDEVRKQTNIANCKSVILDSPENVELMLSEAQKNRSVAATKANERSSRSHSIFILKLVGENSATGERCEGTLNLVDLAGSERLKQSQVEGDRMRETQNINKSLSCLGDVIEALGRGSGHIPYRNSKLTHLLQHSLGGNSKTLMFVMVSPLETHLKETLTSLRFATKVHNTHIGQAKATKKIKGQEQQ